MKTLLTLLCAGAIAACWAAGPAVAAEKAPAQEGKGLERVVERPRLNTTLFQALRQVGRWADREVQVDWTRLRRTGVKQQTPVVLKVRSATPAQLLDLVLAQVGRRGRPLGWYESDGTIQVTTQMRVLHRKSPAVTETDSSDRRRRGQPTGIRTLDFDNLELAQAIEFFRTASGVNFHVNWGALQMVGVSKQTPVTVKAKGVSIARGLDLVTDQLSAGRSKLDSIYWVVDRSVVHISTGSALNKHVRTRVYDVSNLIMAIPNFNAPDVNVSITRDIGGDDDDSGYGDDDDGLFGGDDDDNGGIFGNDDDDDDDGRDSDTEETDRASQRQENREKLIAIIKSTIGEEMWRPTGKGSVRIYNGKLVISQTLLGFKLIEDAIE